MIHEDPLLTIIKSFKQVEQAVSTLGYGYVTEKRLLETHYHFKSGELWIDTVGLWWTNRYGHVEHKPHRFQGEFEQSLSILIERIQVQESLHVELVEIQNKQIKEVTP